MKFKSQMITEDGFDKIVADKMPKVKHQEEAFPIEQETQPQVLKEGHQAIRPLEKEPEEKISVPPSAGKGEGEQTLDVIRLIEDLHGQLLASSRTKRALEMDFASSQKTIQQLAQDNRELRSELEGLKKEIQKFKEIKSESTYLVEENTDALERIYELQQELRSVYETLTKTTQEKNEVLHRMVELESNLEQTELLKIKGKMKEKEASDFSEENRELRSRLGETLTQHMELQQKHDALKKSFNEVKESLTLLRDACKSNYYNLSDPSE